MKTVKIIFDHQDEKIYFNYDEETKKTELRRDFYINSYQLARDFHEQIMWHQKNGFKIVFEEQN